MSTRLVRAFHKHAHLSDESACASMCANVRECALLSDPNVRRTPPHPDPPPAPPSAWSLPPIPAMRTSIARTLRGVTSLSDSDRDVTPLQCVCIVCVRGWEGGGGHRSTYSQTRNKPNHTEAKGIEAKRSKALRSDNQRSKALRSEASDTKRSETQPSETDRGEAKQSGAKPVRTRATPAPSPAGPIRAAPRGCRAGAARCPAVVVRRRAGPGASKMLQGTGACRIPTRHRHE